MKGPIEYHTHDETEIEPDGRFVAVVPTWAAPEGTEVTYKASGKVRRYKMVDGTWVFCPLFSSVLAGSGTYDPASLNDGDGATTTITVTGVALGDLVHASFSLDLQGIILFAWVSAADTVSIRFQNESGGTVNLSSGTIQVRVIPQASY